MRTKISKKKKAEPCKNNGKVPFERCSLPRLTFSAGGERKPPPSSFIRRRERRINFTFDFTLRVQQAAATKAFLRAAQKPSLLNGHFLERGLRPRLHLAPAKRYILWGGWVAKERRQKERKREKHKTQKETLKKGTTCDNKRKKNERQRDANRKKGKQKWKQVRLEEGTLGKKKKEMTEEVY